MGPWFGRGGDRDRATAGRECLDAPLAGRSTPFLLVDEQVLTDNIRAMADLARRRGCRLRPHAKTHKSPDIARLQLDAGAVGLTVATLGEAEVFAAAGFADLFVAYPLWVDRARGARLRALRRTASVLVGVDSEAGVRALSTEAPGTAVLVEVDSGQHRSGTAPERTGELARLARSSGLAVRGVFTFPGHGYHPDRRHEAAAQEADALGRAVGSMSAAGVTAAVVSGGSTPTAGCPPAGPTTELRPGSYVFNDAQQWELGSCTPAALALTCVATVVSHGTGDGVVLDAGSKALGADRPDWTTGWGRLPDHPDVRVVSLSEHHAVLAWDGSAPPTVGSRVRVVPNHVCNAVALADELVRPDGTTWPVSARGALS